jgi:uncharacterized membrane protein HdeD (DUF308 family)
MTTTSAEAPSASIAASLRKLYFVRFGFAIVWAVVVGLTASTISALSATLLVIYPVFDVIAAIVDHRASRATRPASLLYVNMALSVLAAIGLVFAVISGRPAVLLVWGVWAVTAGIVQLAVALRRRSLGGQWPMILSGGISVLAGAGFILQSGSASAPLVGLAGYATLGGIFFLISAIRLNRTATSIAR